MLYRVTEKKDVTLGPTTIAEYLEREFPGGHDYHYAICGEGHCMTLDESALERRKNGTAGLFCTVPSGIGRKPCGQPLIFGDKEYVEGAYDLAEITS